MRAFKTQVPLTKNDFWIPVYPSLDSLRSQIEKLRKKAQASSDHALIVKIDKGLAEILELTNEKKAFEIVKKHLGDRFENDQVLSSKLMQEWRRGPNMHDWSDITFLPFLGKCEKLQYINKLNTFIGFPMENYVPKKYINIKDTLLWKYLFDVWGWKGQKLNQLNWMLDLVAWKLQNPDQRSHRIMLLISEEQGTGKSFFYQMLHMVFSGLYCNFHVSLDGYLDNFNITDAGKLHIWCDDIQSTSEKKTKQIYPKVTCIKQEYERKGETKIKYDEFSELWITSNSFKPLYSTPEDRRQLYFWASTHLIQNRGFFKKAFLETQNLDIGKAFFEFFRTRDVSNFDPDGNPCQEIKTKAQLSSKPVSLSFLLEFFCISDWYSQYKLPGVHRGKWTKYYYLKPDGVIRMGIDRLHTLYQSYNKQFYPGSKPRNKDTFLDHMQKYKILPTNRVHINGKDTPRTICVDLNFELFKEEVQKLYRGFIVERWAHLDDQPKFVREMSEYTKWDCYYP
jgi:hypothetical protein